MSLLVAQLTLQFLHTASTMSITPGVSNHQPILPTFNCVQWREDIIGEDNHAPENERNGHPRLRDQKHRTASQVFGMGEPNWTGIGEKETYTEGAHRRSTKEHRRITGPDQHWIW